MQETWFPFMGQKDPLKEMATHSSILTWEIPWTGGLQSMRLHRIGHLATEHTDPLGSKHFKDRDCVFDFLFPVSIMARGL